jgi:hypothetical protein
MKLHRLGEELSEPTSKPSSVNDNAVHKLSRKVLNWGYKVHNAVHRVLHRCWFSLAHYIFASTLSDHHHLSVRGLWGVEGEGVDSKLQHRQELL